jgi:hypothetical protein
MQAVIEMVVKEKTAIGPCGVSEVKQVLCCLWIVVDFTYLYLSS